MFLITHFYPGGTADQYATVLQAAHPGGELPPGQVYHAAGPTDGGWLITAVWDTKASFDRFVAETLLPALAGVEGGFAGPPQQQSAEIANLVQTPTASKPQLSAENAAVVRRFYEQMCNERKNELADDLFTPDHVLHDPQVPAGVGPAAMAQVVATYQNAVDGHWGIEELTTTDDRVIVRWTGSGTHVAEINGIPATGKTIRVDAISVHRLSGGTIAETWEVWDTLGFLQQLGVIPA